MSHVSIDIGVYNPFYDYGRLCSEDMLLGWGFQIWEERVEGVFVFYPGWR
jgi:hypothetical protein